MLYEEDTPKSQEGEEENKESSSSSSEEEEGEDEASESETEKEAGNAKMFLAKLLPSQSVRSLLVRGRGRGASGHSQKSLKFSFQR